jgi:hypothetical protein
MFHGPVGEALPFFATLGFDCPVRKDPASFLQEVTTPKGARSDFFLAVQHTPRM